MFGRPVRTLLPNLKLESPLSSDEELRDRDRLAKFKRNSREDERRKAQDTDIKIGDLVLMMQAKREKADSTYKNSLYRVMEIQGNGRCTLLDQETEKIFERNVKHLKKYINRNEEIVVKEKDNNSSGADRNVEPDEATEKEEQRIVGEPNAKRKSMRGVKPPIRFEDFE